MTVWVVSANSESGDEYGPFVFLNEPTESELKELIRTECDWWCQDGCKSCDTGPGTYGSYTYLALQEVEVREN